ncbi:hypothetical protein [Variovorax sp. HJSM1_2]|uniref:hypothetical protein n=1 Tax=Variovorax sp. HJSM1_2 TaxID=3366263 RepID=UPI003BD17761
MFTQNFSSTLQQMFVNVSQARFMSPEAAAALPQRAWDGATLAQEAFQAQEVDLAQRVREVGEW